VEEIEEGPHVIIVDLQKPLGRDVRAVMEDKYQPTKCWVENTSWVRHCIRRKRYEHNPPEYKNTPGRRPRTRCVLVYNHFSAVIHYALVAWSTLPRLTRIYVNFWQRSRQKAAGVDIRSTIICTNVYVFIAVNLWKLY